MKIAWTQEEKFDENRLNTSNAAQRLEMIGHDGHLIQAERGYNLSGRRD